MTELRTAVRTTDREWIIGCINGPNLSNLGNRHPARYGTGMTLPDLEARVDALAKALGVVVHQFQSNYEGALLEWLHENAADLDGLLVNPAGSTPYGFALRNAIQDSRLPTLEVHLANPALNKLESAFSEIVVGTVHGMRKHSYTAALIGMVAMLDDGDSLPPQDFWPLM